MTDMTGTGEQPAAKPDAVAPGLNELSGNSGQLPDAVAGLVESYGFVVSQGGEFCSAGEGTAADCIKEADHYAAVYAQDGPVEVEFYAKVPISKAALAQREVGNG